MSILPIYLYGTKILREKALPVNSVSDSVVKLVIDMHETMHNAQGIGLAANQVGRKERVLVVDVSEVEEYKDVPPLTLINPEILSGEGRVSVEEGCLSIPDIRGEVDRDAGIVLRYRDTNFMERELEARGLVARVILHEIDHLNGILFLDHLPKEEQKVHKEALKQIRRGEVDVDYPIISVADKAIAR